MGEGVVWLGGWVGCVLWLKELRGTLKFESSEERGGAKLDSETKSWEKMMWGCVVSALDLAATLTRGTTTTCLSFSA